MDQVDKIIFQNFGLLGWEPEHDVQSLQDLEISDVAELMVKCLQAINPECDLPKSFPHNMAQRFRVAANITGEIKALGFMGDLGYQSILYSNVSELRRIFTFLIEQLPKDAPNLAKEPIGKLYSVLRKAQDIVKKDIQSPWFPPHCRSALRKYKALTNDEVSISSFGASNRQSFASNWLLSHDACAILSLQGEESSSMLNFDDVSSSEFLPSLLNGYAMNAGKNLSEFNSDDEEEIEDQYKSRYTSRAKINRYQNLSLKDLPETSKVNVKLKVVCTEDSTIEDFSNNDEITGSEPQIDDVEQQIDGLMTRIGAVETDVTSTSKLVEEYVALIDKLESDIEDSQKRLSDDQKKLVVLRKTSSVVTDPESTVAKLKVSIESLKEKEVRLQEQWKEFKDNLQQELQDSQVALENKESKKNKVLRDIDHTKKRAESVAEAIKAKEILVSQLRDRKERMPKGQNRSVYTKQIMDICDKVQKQKRETQKVLRETKAVQKDINSLTGKIDRTFAVAEDASYKIACMNDSARPIYRWVVAIHEECGRIVDIIRDSGSVQREVANLNQQIKSEKAKNVEENLKKLEVDFQKLKQENELLKAKVSSSEG